MSQDDIYKDEDPRIERDNDDLVRKARQYMRRKMGTEDFWRELVDDAD